MGRRASDSLPIPHGPLRGEVTAKRPAIDQWRAPRSLSSQGIDDGNRHYALPLTDELAAGHLGRIRILGQAKDRATMLRHLRATQKKETLRFENYAALAILASACDIDTASYARNHSMLPFICFSTRNMPRRSDDGFWDQTVVALVGLRTPRKRAYICVACVQQDIEFRGYSYWRRGHQLPGVQWCQKHGEPLLSVSEPNAFEFLPSTWLTLGKAMPTKHARLTQTRDHPLAKVLVEAVTSMLMGGRSWPIENVRSGLLAKSMDLDLRLAPPGNKPLLSDLAVDALPHHLLEDLVPGASLKERGKYLCAIDGALARSGGTSTSIAIAMTLLYRTAEEAMHACCASAITAERAPIQRDSHGRSDGH